MTLPILIVLGQLVDTYIRWLSFSKSGLPQLKTKIFKYSALWGVASIFLYKIFFDSFGVNAATYKAVLMLGWLPYFFICWRQISGLPQHIFVLGMGTICSLIQHTFVAIIILKLFEGVSAYELILAEAAVYLLLFVIFLPICGQYFINLLPNREFFELRPIGIYIAILPLIISSAHIIQIADSTLIHSDWERLSRIYLPGVFFFFYRYILTAAKNFYDLQRLERNKQRLEDRLMILKEYNALTMENQKKISVIRHDLRHSYNLIYALLESGNIEAAREHIRKQEEWLK
ncbi:MAG: hypothetical protein IJK81_12670 [Selenomonadaceae bacterium]|nr:hypothetical protein [Selenomonadaceae bacterium]